MQTRREIRANERMLEQAHRINNGVQVGKYPGEKPKVIAMVGRPAENAAKYPVFLEA